MRSGGRTRCLRQKRKGSLDAEGRRKAGKEEWEEDEKDKEEQREDKQDEEDEKNRINEHRIRTE